MPDRTLLKEPNINAVAKEVIPVKSQSQNRLKTGKRKAPQSAFKPGRSGNPGGRPKLTPEQKAQGFELMQACRSKSPQAIAVIEQLMHRADRDSVRLAAASLIVERGWGKAVQAMEHSAKDGQTIRHIFKVEIVKPNHLPEQSQKRDEAGTDNGGRAWPT